MFYKKSVLKNFAKLTRRSFPVTFAKFLKTLFSQNTSGRKLFLERFSPNASQKNRSSNRESPINIFIQKLRKRGAQGDSKMAMIN